MTRGRRRLMHQIASIISFISLCFVNYKYTHFFSSCNAQTCFFFTNVAFFMLFYVEKHNIVCLLR